jgi:hypothetical protein
MAKRKTIGQATPATAPEQGESVSGYFRKVFEEYPKLLDSRSNAELLERWLRDHPGEKEVPERVRQNLANIKSVLRKNRRKKPGRKKAARPADAPAPTTPAVATVPRKGLKGLEALEEQIDECLTMARGLDREGLADVILMLRKARNAVVWKMGE